MTISEALLGWFVAFLLAGGTFLLAGGIANNHLGQVYPAKQYLIAAASISIIYAIVRLSRNWPKRDNE